ncbi:MAG: DUF6524 family protein [Pseudomonadales bacterium]
MAKQEISFVGIVLRFVAALILVFATYNPEGYSYYHWAVLNWGEFDPIKALAGILLLIGWTVFLRATGRSLGPFGLVLALAFFGVIVWALIYYKLLATDSTRVITYLCMFIVAGVLTAGMVWSLVRRRVTGQVDVDDVDGG